MACEKLRLALKGRSYNMRLFRKIKSEIWPINKLSLLHQPQLSNSPSTVFRKKLIPIVIPYNFSSSTLIGGWKRACAKWRFSNQVRLVNAFKNNKNIKNNIISGKQFFEILK